MTQGVWGMWDSKTYRYAVETGVAEGRTEEARRFLTGVGERMLGPAPASVQATLAAIDDADALERLGLRLPEVRSWDEL